MQGLDMKKTNRTAQTISSRSLPMGVHHILIFISFSLTVSPEEGQLFYTTPTVSKTAPQRQINIGWLYESSLSNQNPPLENVF